MAGIWTGLTAVALFYHTLRYIDQSERKLTAFLQALHQNDFAVTFSENKNSSDYDLHHAFNQLNRIFRNLRSDRESQHQLLQIIVEHAAVPMICFDERNGEVYIINDAAKSLLQIPFLQKIHSLYRVDNDFPGFIQEILDGEKTSFRLMRAGKPIFLSVVSRHILFQGKQLKLIALHDVSSELAAKEAEAWQKLLRVLTHEISNSAIPLSTLSSYIYDMVTNANTEERKLTEEERQDVLDSLKAIDQRSRSLKEFVQNFRNVNQVPEPQLDKIELDEMVGDVVNLFNRDFENEKIEFHVPSLKGSYIYADKNLTQQVLINILKNAMEAMSNMKAGKVVELSVSKDGNRFTHLHVRDTGTGIAPEEMDQIFIPFYSTKKSGSGIGLSISQQIMQKQKGDIAVQSTPGKGSVFTLTFTSGVSK